MNDLGTLCLLAIFVVVGLLLISRLMKGFASPDYSQPGDEAPRYDDPNIRSRGGFGGWGRRKRPEFDDPNIGSRGSFGRGWSGWTRRRSSGQGVSGGQVDSPGIKSRGSFGRSKQ